jgi:predicted ATP-dependent serine protease
MSCSSCGRPNVSGLCQQCSQFDRLEGHGTISLSDVEQLIEENRSDDDE